MCSSLPESIRRLVNTVLNAGGSTPPFLRVAIKNRAASFLSGDDVPIPLDLQHYVDRVTTCANTVTDQDLALLREAGYSHDELFEITICAAVGAGLVRFEKGLEALEKT